MSKRIVIIGGGLAGLASAVFLARKGLDVTLIEAQARVGGLASGFMRRGFYFDSAMHCLMAGSTAGIYESLGILEEIDFRPYRTSIRIGGQTLIASDAESLTRELCRVFPDQGEGLRRFFLECVKSFAECIVANASIGFPGFYDGWKRAGKLLALLRAISRTGLGTMMKMMKPDGVIANDALAEYIDRGSGAYRYLSNKGADITYKGYYELPNFAGNWVWPFMQKYPFGGFEAMSGSFAKAARKAGAEILTGVRVERILMDGRRAVGVAYRRQGEALELRADTVVSAVDMKRTFFTLIGEERADRDFVATLKAQEMSRAVPILYLGIALDPERVRERFDGCEEVFITPSLDFPEDDACDPDFFEGCAARAFSSRLINPGHAPQGKSNLQVYLPCPPPGWLGNWGSGSKEEYRRIKARVIGQALGTLKRVVPELEDESLIEVCELGTPLTIERYTGNSEGSHCGFTWERSKCLVTGDAMGRFFDGTATGVEGLRLVGHQTSYMGGVTGALWSAKNLAHRL